MYLKDIKLFIQAANMEEQVHFLGYCNGERKANFFKHIDCLIISSLYEPFGMILLEALKHDVPIICSNNGGLAEMMGDYKYQYNPYIKGEFEDIIQVFINDNAKEIKCECSKLKERLKLFSKEEMIKHYQQVFSYVLGECL